MQEPFVFTVSIFCIDALTSGALLILEGLQPPRINQFLERVNNWPLTCLSNANQLIQNPCPQPPPLSSFLHSGPLVPWPNHARTRYQKIRDRPCDPEPTELIQISHSYTWYHARPIPSCKNHNRDGCTQFFLSLPPNQTWGFTKAR